MICHYLINRGDYSEECDEDEEEESEESLSLSAFSFFFRGAIHAIPIATPPASISIVHKKEICVVDTSAENDSTGVVFTYIF